MRSLLGLLRFFTRAQEAFLLDKSLPVPADWLVLCVLGQDFTHEEGRLRASLHRSGNFLFNSSWSGRSQLVHSVTRYFPASAFSDVPFLHQSVVVNRAKIDRLPGARCGCCSRSGPKVVSLSRLGAAWSTQTACLPLPNLNGIETAGAVDLKTEVYVLSSQLGRPNKR